MQRLRMLGSQRRRATAMATDTSRAPWDDVRQVNLSRDVAGERLNDEAQARWDHARDCPLTFRVGLVLMYTARTRHASSRERC
jgi:hypothetical protein